MKSELGQSSSYITVHPPKNYEFFSLFRDRDIFSIEKTYCPKEIKKTSLGNNKNTPYLCTGKQQLTQRAMANSNNLTSVRIARLNYAGKLWEMATRQTGSKAAAAYYNYNKAYAIPLQEVGSKSPITCELRKKMP
jgi:hypothetical protein